MTIPKTLHSLTVLALCLSLSPFASAQEDPEGEGLPLDLRVSAPQGQAKPVDHSNFAEQEWWLADHGWASEHDPWAAALERTGYRVWDIQGAPTSGKAWTYQAWARLDDGGVRVTYREFADAAAATEELQAVVHLILMGLDDAAEGLPRFDRLPQYSVVRGARLIQVTWDPNEQVSPGALQQLASASSPPRGDVAFELLYRDPGSNPVPGSDSVRLKLSVGALGPGHFVVERAWEVMRALPESLGAAITYFKRTFGDGLVGFAGSDFELRIMAPKQAEAGADSGTPSGAHSGFGDVLERSGLGH